MPEEDLMLAWTLHVTPSGIVHRAEQIRAGAVWIHEVRIGKIRDDGRTPFVIDSRTIGSSGSMSAHCLTDQGQDVMDAADIVARSWGGRCR